MGLLDGFKKSREERLDETQQPRRVEAPEAPEPLSEETRKHLIEEARSDLAELDRKFEQNLERLKELSRS